MNAVRNDESVRPWQKATRDVLRAAYPNGVPPDEYEALVYVLSETMSFRSIAHVLSDCGVRDYARAYNDVLGIVDRHEKYAAAGKPILAKLIAHGYDPDAD